jgi:hypothetical protein
MSFWDHISESCKKTYGHFHSKDIDMNDEDRLKGVIQGMEEILHEVGSNKEEMKQAEEYIQKRDLDKARLTAIQMDVEDKINYMFTGKCNFDVIPASSFSAGIYLLGESDLDISVPVIGLNQRILIQMSNICGEKGFKFIEIRRMDEPGEEHFVFQKFIDGVEIELKIRYGEYYMNVHHKMHHYLDHDMPERDKMIITWIKSNLKKKSKEVYATFKALYYEYALGKAGVDKLLYPLH